MSDIFERFEKEYTALSASVGSKVAALSKAGPADDRAANIATADAELMQADELLQQMELEARSVTAKERPRLQTRLKGYKSDVTNLRKEIKEARAVAAREQLMSGGRSPPESADQQAHLLQINERTRSGTEKLRQAQATALEAEAIGNNIMSDLRSQRETIMHATGTLQRANEGLARGSRVLNSIGRRALANKLLMWLMILLLTFGIIMLMYLELFGGPGGGGGGGKPAGNASRALLEHQQRL